MRLKPEIDRKIFYGKKNQIDRDASWTIALRVCLRPCGLVSLVLSVTIYPNKNGLLLAYCSPWYVSTGGGKIDNFSIAQLH